MLKKVDVKRFKKKFKKNGGKKAKKAQKIKFVNFNTPAAQKPTTPKRQKYTRATFENLGLDVVWANGAVIINRNGREEVYNNFDELRVPSRKATRDNSAKLTKPNAVYVEHNGAKYYYFPRIFVLVMSCIHYWPEDAEGQPPETMFRSVKFDEVLPDVAKQIKEHLWNRALRKAIKVAKREAVMQNGGKLPVPEKGLPLLGLIEDLEKSGIAVKVKIR